MSKIRLDRFENRPDVVGVGAVAVPDGSGRAELREGKLGVVKRLSPWTARVTYFHPEPSYSGGASNAAGMGTAGNSIIYGGGSGLDGCLAAWLDGDGRDGSGRITYADFVRRFVAFPGQIVTFDHFSVGLSVHSSNTRHWFRYTPESQDPDDYDGSQPAVPRAGLEAIRLCDPGDPNYQIWWFSRVTPAKGNAEGVQILWSGLPEIPEGASTSEVRTLVTTTDVSVQAWVEAEPEPNTFVLTVRIYLSPGDNDEEVLASTKVVGPYVDGVYVPEVSGVPPSRRTIACTYGGASFALDDTDGSAWSWGRNWAGLLGANESDPDVMLASPEAVSGPHVFDAVVAGGGTHALAVEQDGSLWGWGSSSNFELGVSEMSVTSPILVAGVTPLWVATGYSFSAALRSSDRRVVMWGTNGQGQLGSGSTSPAVVGTPTPVACDRPFLQVGCGYDFAAALSEDGRVWTWGKDRAALGRDYGGGANLTPLPVNLNGVVRLAASWYNVYALDVNGRLWAWGDGNALGDGVGDESSVPVAVAGNHFFVDVSAGRYFAAALDGAGQVWAWGANLSGQLGDDSESFRSTPVSATGGHSFVQIACGYTWMLARKANGQLWAWGEGNWGQVGDTYFLDRSNPTLVARTFEA